MECLTCKALINQRTPTLLPLADLEERLNLKPREGRVLRTVNAAGVQEKFGTFWWLHKQNGNRKAYGSTEAGPMWAKSLLIISDYRSGLGCKAIADKRMGDTKCGAMIARLICSLGMMESGRRSPHWDGLGSGQTRSVDLAIISGFERDQREWARGVKAYELALWPKPKRRVDWREQHNRMMASPERRIKFYLRKRLRHCVIDKQHSLASEELFGCTMSELRAHLESLFSPWMTWENYGKRWHIDHEKPCRAFKLTDPEQAKACFHYSNLRPMEAKENILKSDKLADGTRARHAA